jgi:hypothetical protein
MKELYAGYEAAVLMLSDVLDKPECATDDLLGEAAILPILRELVGHGVELNAADRTTPTLVDQIKAATQRLDISLPDGWKSEVARRLASTWATKSPGDLPVDVLVRAATLFAAINSRFLQFDYRAAAPADGDIGSGKARPVAK